MAVGTQYSQLNQQFSTCKGLLHLPTTVWIHSAPSLLYLVRKIRLNEACFRQRFHVSSGPKICARVAQGPSNQKTVMRHHNALDNAAQMLRSTSDAGVVVSQVLVLAAGATRQVE